jgi:proline iminopeptidase
VGLWLAHEHPELIFAFVGTGQAIDMDENETVGYRDALEEARHRHNEEAVKELEGIAPYPTADGDARKTSVARTWDGRLLGPPPNGVAFTDIRRILLTLVSAPEYSIGDDVGFLRGQALSVNTMLPEMMKTNLKTLGPEFGTPIFFFEGRYDPYCRPSVVWDYMQEMQAPRTEFVWYEKSGHFPFYEEKEKFTSELEERVLPLEKRAGGGGSNPAARFGMNGSVDNSRQLPRAKVSCGKGLCLATPAATASTSGAL